MNILAMSDLHGRLPKLPKAIEASDIDLFIDCGDTAGHDNKNWGWNDYFGRTVDVPAEAVYQREWLTNTYKPWVQKTLKPKKTLRLNGNHDFCATEDLFDYNLFEGAKTVVVDGIKIGMMTGMGKLAGEWHDEIGEEEVERRIHLIDRDIQILVTHCPPHSIRDQAYSGQRIGFASLTKAIFGSSLTNQTPYFTHMTHHFMGHAHEARGHEIHEIDGRAVHFMNVAETYCTVEANEVNLKATRVSFHSK